MKFFTKKTLIAVFISLATLNVFSQTTLIGGSTNNGNFEAVAITPWVVANNPSANTDNRWVTGIGVALGGLKSAYVTNDFLNTYAYTVTQARTQHIYQQVNFPAGQMCNITLTFDWRCNGESTIGSGNDRDNLKVFVSSTLPVGGTANANADQVGLTFYNLQNSTQSASINLPSSLAGTTKYIIFQYKCNNSAGAQAPAAIDNVSLTVSNPPVPACASYIAPVNGTSVCPVSQNLSWNAVASPTCGSITYDVYFNSGTTATTLASSSQAGTTYATGGLTNGTTYAWRIVPRNSGSIASGCSTFTFVASSGSGTTTPINEDFEYCNDWTIVNGTQANKWVHGTATDNGGAKSMYISDDGGTSYSYNNNSSSVTHFYKNIAFPAGQTCITFSFDWKGDGQNNQDYLEVFAIPTSSNPVAGTQITATSLTGDLRNETTWQSQSITLPASYAGTTQRIVFSWRNNNSNGNDPPAAVDNIIITSSFPPTPTCANYISPANSTTLCNIGQTLSWGAVSTPTCGSILYDVYFNAGTTATTLASSGQAGLTYATGALVNGTTYAWSIVPKNGVITASGCSTYTFLAVNNPTPNCVNYISPTDGSNVCATAQTLSWNAITSLGCGTITYDVYFNAGSSATTLVSVGQTGTSYVTPVLTAGTNYAWKVVVKSGTVSAVACSENIITAIATQVNDLPCNATNVVIGTIASGDNNCTSNTGEPATPSCWTTGSVNSVWFSFTAPVSGNVKMRTAPGTLLNTQIAVYSGACGSGMTMITGACNKDAANCGSNTVLLSELSLTGLTSGTTYYVAVDGENSLVGTFAIAIIEGSAAYPLTSGQICTSPNPVCNAITQIGDPGNQGVGLTCDDNGSGNCTGGERGSVWYTINTGAAGSLVFNIIPNDYNAAFPGTETDYDFVLWKTTGAGATSCSLIQSTGGASVTACNYSAYGVTGVSTSGDAPAGYSGVYDGAFQPGVTVAAGETYVILIENYSNSTKGFQLDLSGSDPGVISFANPTTVIWTGGQNTTSWTNTNNWGGCNIPSCSLNAIISTISSYQPLISASMGTVTVNDLTVDPGAILNLGANSVLKICGNLYNNGTILANPSSTILFSDNVSHTLNGTLSGSSKLGNLVITDVAGGANCTVIANNDVEIKNNFTTTNSTSIFNLNGKSLTLGGDFTNSAGASTFSNTAGSTITFNGSASQTYNPNANTATPTLTLNNVVANHVGPGINLSTTNTPNMILGTSGALILTAGKIITPNNQEVTIMNTNASAVSAGNTTSFVQGNLRRNLAAGATGSFEFPVGHATPGYERANINFTTGAAAGAINLLARFDPWGGAWTMPGAPNWTECSTTYNAPYLNNGYWTINASSPSTGLYNLTLYNTSYTTTSAGFSIAKSPSASPSWTLNGNCSASPVTAVVRTGMSGFSKMATIQGNAPLPVELISFDGIPESTYNSIFWKSAVEVNFKHYEVESSADGISFSKITTVNPLGNVSALNNYSYIDFDRYSPITYYRLKMVDLDYTFKYSNIIALENGLNKSQTLVVYPNPASSELYVKVIVPGEKEAALEIRDIFGRIIYQQKIDLNQPVNNNYINTSNFAAGTYIINVTAGNSFSENTKVVIGLKNQ